MGSAINRERWAQDMVDVVPGFGELILDFLIRFAADRSFRREVCLLLAGIVFFISIAAGMSILVGLLG